MKDAVTRAIQRIGLTYVRPLECGAVWHGSDAELAEARATLPAWALVGAVDDPDPPYHDWASFRAWATTLTQEYLDGWETGRVYAPKVSIDGSPPPDWGEECLLIWDTEFCGGLRTEGPDLGTPLWSARDHTPDWDMDHKRRERFFRIQGVEGAQAFNE